MGPRRRQPIGSRELRAQPPAERHGPDINACESGSQLTQFCGDGERVIRRDRAGLGVRGFAERDQQVTWLKLRRPSAAAS
jgi:hypothetical protein